jgi:hypothetical protein
VRPKALAMANSVLAATTASAVSAAVRETIAVAIVVRAVVAVAALSRLPTTKSKPKRL